MNGTTPFNTICIFKHIVTFASNDTGKLHWLRKINRTAHETVDDYSDDLWKRFLESNRSGHIHRNHLAIRVAIRLNLPLDYQDVLYRCLDSSPINHMSIDLIIVSGRVSDYRSSFHQALRVAELPVIERFFSLGLDLNTECPSPLCTATNCGRFEVVKALVDRGATLTPRSLHAAIERGSMEILKYHIENGVDIEGSDPDDDGVTPLQRACKKTYYAIVAYLLSKGARYKPNLMTRAVESSRRVLTALMNHQKHVPHVVMARRVLEMIKEDEYSTDWCLDQFVNILNHGQGEDSLFWLVMEQSIETISLLAHHPSIEDQKITKLIRVAQNDSSTWDKLSLDERRCFFNSS